MHGDQKSVYVPTVLSTSVLCVHMCNTGVCAMSCRECVQCRVGSVYNVVSGVCTMSCRECVQSHVGSVYNVVSGVCTISCRECVQSHVGSVYNVMFTSLVPSLSNPQIFIVCCMKNRVFLNNLLMFT